MNIKDMNEARDLTDDVVREVVASHLFTTTGAPFDPDNIETGKSITGAGMSGYGRTPAVYRTICTEIRGKLRAQSGRRVNFDEAFIVAHESAPILAFIADGAGVLFNSPIGLGADV